MDSSIILIIVAILIVSVVGSIIFTKKEQAATLRRQQVATFRYRADEAQDLYDGLQVAGLEKIAYHFLLERIIRNLEEAYKVDPHARGIKARLSSAKSTLNQLDSMQFYVQMPSAMMELQGLISRLNKLVKYLIVLFQKRAIPEHIYQQLMPAIQRTLLKFDAEGHIKMGHQAANDGQPGTAKQYYVHAKEKLSEFGSEDAYVTSQLEKVDDLIIAIDKSSTMLGEEYNSPQESVKIASMDEKSQEQIAAKAAQEALNKESETDGGFSEKKKW